MVTIKIKGNTQKLINFVILINLLKSRLESISWKLRMKYPHKPKLQGDST